jgi:hypothetical protein
MAVPAAVIDQEILRPDGNRAFPRLRNGLQGIRFRVELCVYVHGLSSAVQHRSSTTIRSGIGPA